MSLDEDAAFDARETVARPGSPAHAAQACEAVIAELLADGDATERPRVLVCDDDPRWRSWVIERLAADFATSCAASARDLRAVLGGAGAPPALAIVGARVGDLDGGQVVASLRGTPVLWVERPGALAPPGVSGTIRPTMSPSTLRQLVHATLRTPPAPLAPAAPVAPSAPSPPRAVVPAARWQRLGEALRQAAMQRSPRDLARVITTRLAELCDADRATCLFHDPSSGALWLEADDPAHDAEGHTDEGLAGQVARTGRPALRAHAAAPDAPFAPHIDDPFGAGADVHLAALPVVGHDGAVHAVLVLARGARGAAFGERELELAGAFATRLAPLLDALTWDAEAAEAARAVAPSLFRAEAVAAHRQRGGQGDVVRVHSTWVHATYWLVLAAALAALTYGIVARVDEFSTGPAVVIAGGRSDVAPLSAGVVDEILVAPGTKVAAGQVVARLRDDEARAELAAADAELEQQIVARLLAPDDPAPEAALAALTARRARAATALARLELRAPAAGVASETRVAPGTAVAAGEPLLSIVSGEADYELVAALPAGVAPLAHPGMHARVELAAHPGEYQELTLVSIGRDAFGPAAAQRKLGGLLGDTVPLAGAVVFARFALPAGGFHVGGKPLAYRHGLTGRVDLRLRSQRLVTALVPGLQELFGHEYL